MGKYNRKSGERRSKLKRFASDNVQVNRGANPEAVGQYHDRVKTTSGSKTNAMPVMNNTFMKEIPTSLGYVNSAWADRQSSKKEMKKKEEHYRNSESLAFINTWNKIMVENTTERVLTIRHSGNRFVVIEETSSYRRASVVYGSMLRAMQAIQLKHVCYIAVLTL